MYESFYGFEKRAFATVPDTAHYYPVDELIAARETLSQVIENGEGPGVVVGPAGVGKTLLCGLLEERFRPHFHVVTLACGQLRELRDMLQSIVHQLRLPHQGQNEGELRLTLLDFLEPSAECPRGMLLLVDEAQHLSLELLEEVRMISNFVRNGSPRVRVVLLGNDRLEDNLTNPKLESLNQRLAARCYLQGLSREETRNYVEGLCNAAGAPGGLWSEDGLRSIFDASNGVPRVINQVCNRSLATAAENRIHQISGTHVQQAWSDLQQLPTPWCDDAAAHSTESAAIEFGGLDEEAAPEMTPQEDAPAFEALDGAADAQDTQDMQDIQDPISVAMEQITFDTMTLDAPQVDEIEEELPVANANSEGVASLSHMVQYELAPEAARHVEMIEARLAEIEETCGAMEPPLSATGEFIQNPFGEFPEEEVILAEHLQLGETHQTVGPRVSNVESRLLADTLQEDEPNPPVNNAGLALGPDETIELSAPPRETFNQREIGIDANASPTAPHEPATVVPIFAATRDDRDMIIIEDEHARPKQNRDVIHQLRGS